MDTVEPKSKRTAVIFPRQRKMLNILGENLTLAMKRRGITQEMMHSRTGISKPTLRKISKGDSSQNNIFLYKCSVACGSLLRYNFIYILIFLTIHM